MNEIDKAIRETYLKRIEVMKGTRVNLGICLDVLGNWNKEGNTNLLQAQESTDTALRNVDTWICEEVGRIGAE